MRSLFGLILGLADTLVTPVLAAFFVALLISASGLDDRLGPLGWIVIAPLLYVAWLFAFLCLCACEIRILLRLFPKHSRIEVSNYDPASVLKIHGVRMCYVRLGQILALPLARTLVGYDGLRQLVLLAYSPRTQLGRGTHLGGLIYDPDLTELSDGAALGGQSVLVSHSMNITATGMVYICAPIKIGPRATIGGETRIAMGVTVGADAVIEPGSNVLPFTNVPSGQVWGGNPAIFQRYRAGFEQQEVRRELAPLATAAPPPEPLKPIGESVAIDDIRALVSAALNLPLETISADLAATNCSAWDSLGQLAIATALFNRFGLQLQPREVFELHSVSQIALRVSRHLVAGRRQSDVPETIDDDAELLPLLDHSAATQALARRYQNLPAQAEDAALKVAVAATFTANSLANSLEIWSRAFGIPVKTEFFDYNQIEQALLSTSSSFRVAHIAVVLIRTEDLPLGSEADCRAMIERLLGAIRSYLANRANRAKLIVGTLPPTPTSMPSAVSLWLDDLRACWKRGLAAMPDVELLEFSRIIEQVGTAAASNPALEVVARIPYSPLIFQELGIQLARLVRKQRRPPAKVLALDCDGTLWGGVLGEDGISGIQLSSDGPERCYQMFQRLIRQIKDRGVLLVLVSRNKQRDVWEVFDKHPGMILRREDIAAWRINWQDKSHNLRELAAELNLGLDSFVFADDDPAVRAEVAAHLPQVTVVPLPQDPSRYCETLSLLWSFDGIGQTAEDSQRTEMIRREKRRQNALEQTSDLNAYLRELELEVEMRPADEAQLSRVAQLTQKTNQFNLSLRRRHLEQLRGLNDTHLALATRARDRFGDYGLIGVIIVKLNAAEGDPLELDTFLLSCRALGRGIEEAMLHAVFNLARVRGAREIVAPYAIGPRNEPALNFFRQNRFLDADLAFLCKADIRFPVPGHLRFTLNLNPEPAEVG